VPQDAPPQRGRVNGEHLVVGGLAAAEREPEVLLHRVLEVLRQVVEGAVRAEVGGEVAVAAGALVVFDDQQGERAEDVGTCEEVTVAAVREALFWSEKVHRKGLALRGVSCKVSERRAERTAS